MGMCELVLLRLSVVSKVVETIYFTELKINKEPALELL